MIFVCIIVICTPWAFMDQGCWGLPDKNPKEQYVLFEVTNDLGFTGALVVKNLPAGVWTLGWEDPLEKEITTHSNIQYSFLGNPMDRGDGRVSVHGVAKDSDTTNEDEFYFLGLYATCVSILLKCWLKYLAHFNWVVFLLWNFDFFTHFRYSFNEIYAPYIFYPTI